MRFEDAPLRRWLADATATGCAVTLDVAPVRPSWMLDPEQLAQFRRVLSDGGLEAASPLGRGRNAVCAPCGDVVGLNPSTTRNA